MVVGVLVQLSSQNVDRVFDYLVPEHLIPSIKVGVRVLVPFGKQNLEGFILEIKTNSDRELKEIYSILDKDVILNDELLLLGKEIQNTTLSTLISAYQVMLPKALKAKAGVTISKKYQTFYEIKDKEYIPSSLAQRKILELFSETKIISRKVLLEISSSALSTLLEKGVLSEIKEEDYRMKYDIKRDTKKVLTKAQQNVVDSVLNDQRHVPFLLFGVTGSGKTEVYMQIIEKVLKKGKTAIILVPEISLTPQMIEHFSNRFGNQIAALHSALSEGEKYDEWRRIARGEANIVIGARSAIFAPLKNIGIIIMDEEHSDSYKQGDKNPRYHARDIAIWRGKYHSCPVLLGSATPSLESMARARKGVYELVTLQERVNGKMLPEVEIIDMNQESKRSSYHITNTLLKNLNDCIKRGDQAILFLNRRGFSTFVTCKNCSEVIKCPNCDITLTYHKSNKMLRCHYCGYATPLPKECPKCHENSLSDLGVGTEKIEEELHILLPSVKVLRMDVDTTSKKGAHKKMIDAFRNHEYDILLGTQIVAKGLDFSDVTLVGVINADTSLNIPDFRSSENTYSLLSQVAGRSGRSSKTGKVLIQTFNPDHYAISFVKHHDYLGFYNEEMKIRKRLGYPPFYFLCYLKISGKEADYLFQESLKIKRSLERNLQYTTILGPTTLAVFKVNNIYRYGIILKYKKEDMLYDILLKIQNHYKNNHKIKVDIDFNPSHF
ncbi:MAG: primosomal protein N' [Candidatus Faecimonas sp.]|nr:primosomal protein N' [Mycoplasmatota bacterium]MDY2908724.1 primosomal protein N' [Candidatus Faecimonas sp.]